MSGTVAPSVPFLDSGESRNYRVRRRGGNQPWDKPTRYRFGGGPPMSREQSLQDQSPGHSFLPIAHAGCRRHTKV